APKSRLTGITMVFQNQGPQFFSLCMPLIMVTTMYSVVLEKDCHIRLAMKSMGLKTSAYWISWYITAGMMALLQILIGIGYGHALGLWFFTQTDFGVLLVMFISFAASLIPLAFLLSSFVNTAKAALVLGFFVFALSYVLNQ